MDGPSDVNAVTRREEVPQTPDLDGDGLRKRDLKVDIESPISKEVTPIATDDRYTDSSEAEPAGAQILGVAVLEFGILFHSVGCLMERELTTAHHRDDLGPSSSGGL